MTDSAQQVSSPTSGSAKQRKVPAALQLKAQGTDAAPALSSPRSQLLDRIRTPRRFVPEAIKEQEESQQAQARQSANDGEDRPTSAPGNDKRNPQTGNLKELRRFSVAGSSNIVKDDKLARLEQQLRDQNNVLLQQRILLEAMQAQQYSPFIASPPYTPKSAFHARRHSLQFPQSEHFVYDQNTGNCVAYGPPSPGFIAPQLKATASVFTPESVPKKRSNTPPKEGHPSRQPKGPPPFDALTSPQSPNFSVRTRRRAAKILEAGLNRRRISPSPEQVPPKSRGSDGMTNIEEAFPAMTV